MRECPLSNSQLKENKTLSFCNKEEQAESVSLDMSTNFLDNAASVTSLIHCKKQLT